MMNNRWNLLFLFLFSSTSGMAQAIVYSFKVELLINSEQTKAASNVDLIINGTRQTTDPQGMIYLTLNSSVQTVRVDSPNEGDYVLAESSKGGIINLPANSQAITTILLRNPSDKERAFKELNTFYKNNNIERKQIDSLKNVNYAKYEEIIRMQDSIYSELTKHYKISEADLRNASEIMDGRDHYFQSVSSSLQGFLNEARDVRDAFKKLVEFSLENPAAFKLLDSTIRAYNDYYMLLNNNRDEYERAIENYWKSFELAMGFHNTVDFALNDVHRANIIPLNTTVIQKANEYIGETNKKRKKELKNELQASLDLIIPTLDNDLVILDDKTQSCIAKLSASKNLFPD